MIYNIYPDDVKGKAGQTDNPKQWTLDNGYSLEVDWLNEVARLDDEGDGSLLFTAGVYRRDWVYAQHLKPKRVEIHFYPEGY